MQFMKSPGDYCMNGFDPDSDTDPDADGKSEQERYPAGTYRRKSA